MIRILLSTRLGERKWTQADLVRETGIRASTINDLYHEMTDRVKEIGVLKHTILIALMFSRQQITIIHIVECCKLLKNMSVFFQSKATP